MKEKSDNLQKSKMQLIMTNPFFARILLMFEFVEDKHMFPPTMATDGLRLYYHPEFIKQNSVQNLIGVLVHETEHVLFNHLSDIVGKNLQVYNMACDYAINQLILDNGFSLPEKRLLDKRFQNMNHIKIYNILMSEFQDQEKNGQGNGPGGQGQGNMSNQGGNFGQIKAPVNQETGKPLTQAEIDIINNNIQMNVAAALETARQQGNLPQHLERLAKAILTPKISWEEIMREFMTAKVRNDYTYIKPNKRYASTGFIQASLENPSLGDIVIAIDTSGSLSEKEHSHILGQIINFLNQYTCKLYLIYCDCQVNKVIVIDQNDTELPTKLYGGGGTDFRPVFNYLEQEQIEPTCVIYFTDGYCSSFSKQTSINYPVCWIITTANDEFKTNIGTSVRMRLDD